MKTSRILPTLLALNLALLALTVRAGSAAQPAEGAFDCCKPTVEGGSFCCDNCCWFTNDCWGPGDCAIKVE